MPTYPDPSKVLAGTVYGPNGNDFTGTLTLPPEKNVEAPTQFGAGGTEFTGNLVVPLVSDVRLGVNYGPNGTGSTGQLHLPAANVVLVGEGFGADGVEFIGTLSLSGGDPADPRQRTSKWTVTVAPATRPVTWAEAKAHLRLEDDTQQAYVETLIDAATDYAQEAMATSLMPQTLLATFYDGERLELPRGPLIEVQSIVDRDGDVVTDYDLAHVGHSARVVLNQGHGGYPLSVTYRAGHASAAAIPAGIRLAIRTHVGTLFEHRESVSDRQRLPVPHSLEAFYRQRSRKTGVA